MESLTSLNHYPAWSDSATRLHKEISHLQRGLMAEKDHKSENIIKILTTEINRLKQTKANYEMQVTKENGGCCNKLKKMKITVWVLSVTSVLSWATSLVASLVGTLASEDNSLIKVTLIAQSIASLLTGLTAYGWWKYNNLENEQQQKRIVTLEELEFVKNLSKYLQALKEFHKGNDVPLEKISAKFNVCIHQINKIAKQSIKKTPSQEEQDKEMNRVAEWISMLVAILPSDHPIVNKLKAVEERAKTVETPDREAFARKLREGETFYKTIGQKRRKKRSSRHQTSIEDFSKMIQEQQSQTLSLQINELKTPTYEGEMMSPNEIQPIANQTETPNRKTFEKHLSKKIQRMSKELVDSLYSSQPNQDFTKGWLDFVDMIGVKVHFINFHGQHIDWDGSKWIPPKEKDAPPKDTVSINIY